MLMQTHDTQSFTGGLAEQAAFKVEMNSMLFHSVINGIYADKVRAPFRELATNARDGHAEAGKLDVPFDITLPSLLSSTFAVRDYGCSMDHDEIMGLYSTMFASSKRSSNAAVGMIGLGSKSPFAYTNIFNVSAWLDGRKRQYSCFIGSDDVPQIALITEEGSNQPDGIEVSFAVKPVDVNKFRAAAPEVLFGFDPKPNILNEQYDFKEPVVLYEGDGWTIYDPTSVPFSTLQARQGCVLYPISKTAMNASDPLYDWAAVIDFPIGELAVATSREALGYDQTTRDNITKRLAETKEKMTSIVSAEIDAAETYLDACCILDAGLDYNNPLQRIFTLLKDALTWNGRPLRKSFVITTLTAETKIAHLDPNYMDMGVEKRTVAHRPAISMGALQARHLRDNTLIYYESETTKLGPSRMRTVIAENVDDKRILWVRGNPAPLQAQIGDKEIIDIGTVEPTSLAGKSKNSAGFRSLRVFAPTTSFSRYSDHDAAKFETVEITPDLVYVQQEDSRFNFYDLEGKNWFNTENLHNGIYWLIKDGILPTNFTVYCLNKVNIKLLDKVAMKPLSEVVKAAILAKLPTLNLKPDNRYAYQTRDQMVARLRELSVGLTLPDDIEAWAKMIEDEKQVTTKPVALNYTTLQHIKTFCPDEVKKTEAGADPIAAAQQKLDEKYPLLLSLIPHYTSDSSLPRKFNHYMELLAK